MKTFLTERFSLFFLLVGSILWLGGINIRAILADQLLVAMTLEFEPDLNPLVEREIFRMINYSSLVIFAGYLLVFFNGIIFLRRTHLRLKDHGWLMMSAILFYIFTPVEIYTAYLDGKMASLEFAQSVENSVFRELFIKRVAALEGLPFIALLCYYTIIGLIVWQPMKKQTEA